MSMNLDLPKAEASPQEVLDLKPNTVEEATTGPDPSPSPTTYVKMSRPDGGEFLAPLSNVEHYEQKGFVAGAKVEIPDFAAYLAEQSARKSTSTSTTPPRGEHAEAPAKATSKS